MRLLTKDDITKAKASDRALEVQEGLKLAKRVDSLRETVAQEEASLEKFRVQTIAKIHEEIEQKTKEKDILTFEVTRLKREREEALKPLTHEWEKIAGINEGLEQERSELDDRENIVAHQERAIQEEAKALEVERHRIHDERERTSLLLLRAEEDKKSSEKHLRESEAIRENAVRFKEKVTEELVHRDIDVATRERGCIMKEKHLKEKERELKDKERAINDKYQTLLITQKHVTSR